MTKPRARIEPARKLLEATGESLLPERVAARLLPLARTAADFRFLMHHAPTKEVEEALVEKAPSEPDLAAELEIIRKRRRTLT